MTFEESVRRLEEIVHALEENELSLDRALELFEEGIACLREATAEVTKAEASVKVLRERAGGLFETTDLDA
jgi:exodeoxyribonuclease VII small subunit